MSFAFVDVYELAEGVDELISGWRVTKGTRFDQLLTVA
jgi:hypothetical protein